MSDFTGVPQFPDMPTVRPEVAAALKLAKDNIPPYPTEILKELGSYIGPDPWKQPLPNFKGWQWRIGDCWDGCLPNNVACNLEEGYWDDKIDLSDIGYVGIWRGRTAKKQLIYCALPSMKYGEVNPGVIIRFGDIMRVGWKQEDVDAMIRQGHEIMMRLIAEHGAYKGENQ